MHSPVLPSRPCVVSRVVALLLAAVMAVGAGVAPAAAASECHVCLADLFGSDCGSERGAVDAATSCCAQPEALPAQSPGEPPDDRSDDCHCPCSHCCLPLGRAPVTVSTGNRVSLSMLPAFSPTAVPVLSRPVGVHTSVFHPPRA